MEAYQSILKQAFHETAERELAVLPSEQSLSFEFSESFERKIHKLIKSRQSSLWKYTNTVGKRAAIIVMAVLLSTSISMSVDAVRTPIVNFIIEMHEKFTAIIYNEEPSAAETIEVIYTLAHLPVGYNLQTNKTTDFYSEIMWEKAGHTLTLKQTVLSGTDLTFDSEYSEVSEVSIHNSIGFLLRRFGQITLIWSEHGYSFTMHSTENLENDEILALAETLKIK